MYRFNKNINMVKIVVFDVDGTLLHRSNKKVHDIKTDGLVNKRYIYYRPHLKQLSKYIRQQKQTKNQFIPVLWSSMKDYNAKPISEMLSKDWGLQFDRIFHQDHCLPNLSKDLTVIAKQYNIPVSEVILVDDSINKRIGQQNFMQLVTYDGLNLQDQELLRIIKELQIIQNSSPQQLEAPIFIPLIMELKKGQSEQQTQQHIPYDPTLKLIVFDLNKTLIAKRKQSQPLEGLESDTKIKGQLVYLRPNLQAISLFAEKHTHCNLRLIIWTTMNKKRAAQYFKVLTQDAHLPFGCILDVSQSTEDHGKDLIKACKLYNSDINNAILIDDSPHKSFKQQNFIKIESFRGDQNDDELIRVVKQLDKFIQCKQECQIKKLNGKKFQKMHLIIKQSEPRHKESDTKHKKQDSQKNHKKKHKYQKKFLGKVEQQTQEKVYKKIEVDQIKITDPNTIQNKQEQKIAEYKVKYYASQQALPIKCLIFDINQTLLNREVKQIEGIKCDKKFNHYYNYLRPNLNAIEQFIGTNKHIMKGLWTTIKLKNSEHMRELLEKNNLHFDFMLTQEDLINMRKDLRFVSEKFKFKLEQIALVDDNFQKRVENQNFVHLQSFNPKNQDDDILIHLANELKLIIAKVETK